MQLNQSRIIVKIGTSTLTAGSPRLHLPQIVGLAQQIAALSEKGHQVVLVSSGAIAVGKENLGFPELPKSIPGKQMLAAVGQPRLMNVYESIFGIYDKKVAQILLTREDTSDRKRYLNARNTLESLLAHGVVPVVNENDTVATEEIRIGDNDNLSAMVANLVEADLLVLLTDQEGLFTADPKKDQSAALIHEITGSEIPQEIWKYAGGTDGELGTGGMFTKLQAADVARKTGTRVVIADGRKRNILLEIVQGKQVGTHILPLVDKMESRKRFLLAGINTGVSIIVDMGAADAICSGGSLLPVGVVGVGGDFERGDIVIIEDKKGYDRAVGLADYSSDEIKMIMGRKSSEIEKILGYAFGDEVVHHNNMAITGSTP